MICTRKWKRRRKKVLKVEKVEKDVMEILEMLKKSLVNIKFVKEKIVVCNLDRRFEEDSRKKCTFINSE